MRNAKITRKTKETDIELELNLDGCGESSIDTGIGFLDHMLTLFAKHGGFDLNVKCHGDLEVDNHHSMEDIGIAIGQAINQCLSDKKGITRYANVYLPMDESLVRCTIDISGRSYLVFNCEFTREFIGHMETEMVEEFFRAVTDNGKITMHITCLYGKNNHHMVEAMFKGFGRCLKQAAAIDPNLKGVLSTKGVL
ncbi:MAG: imidazoleglycerol-phosphate dehydratase HisB [Lachnospiraceae bacterium]|nr:imidazoleglycerol-phosphate dehydratase HisB [Lachnospiraceae bacterium]